MQVLWTTIRPTTQRMTVQIVPIMSSGSSNTRQKRIAPRTRKRFVSPPGSARPTTFGRNLPFILALFGSIARMKPGMPMVSAETRLICALVTG